MPRSGHAAARFVFAAIAVLAAVPLRAAEQPSGIVKVLTGSAVVVHGGEELPLNTGRPIVEGDTIRTAPDGRVGITLKDGTRLSLGGNAELRIDRFAYAPAQGHLALALKLLRGATEYISGRIAHLAPGAVTVETPKAVIGIRGTHLLIGVDQP